MTVRTADKYSCKMKGLWLRNQSATSIVGISFDDLKTTFTGYCTHATVRLASQVAKKTKQVSPVYGIQPRSPCRGVNFCPCHIPQAAGTKKQAENWPSVIPNAP